MCGHPFLAKVCFKGRFVKVQIYVKVTLKVTHLRICRKEVVYVEVDEFEDEAPIQEREAFLQIKHKSQTRTRSRNVKLFYK